MVDGPIEPIESTPPALRVESHSDTWRSPSSERRHIQGDVVAVHRRSGHHEGHHILDATVGAEPYNEVVVRVEGEAIDDLVGMRVVMTFAGE